MDTPATAPFSPGQESDTIRTHPEKFYSRIVEEVSDYAIILLDLEGNILNWNPGAKAIKGYEADEAVGQNFRMFYTTDDRRAGLPDRLLAQAREHRRVVHEGWRIRKDGSMFWGSVVITALHEGNNVAGFAKVTRDLTERKENEERMERLNDELGRQVELLRRSEERYQRMVAEVEDYAIILLDRDGNILNWNLGAEKIKGYKREEILGCNFRTFYLQEDRESGLPDTLLEKARIENKATHEGWRVRKDGTRFWGLIVITALHDDRGEVIGFSKVTRDLTQKKRYEDFILMQNKQLEEFAFVASHDLQEPLRKIMIFADMLGQPVIEPDKTNAYIDKIKISAARMSALIKGVLEYSQAADHESLHCNVDLDVLLAEIVDDFEIALSETQGSVSWNGLPKIKANPIQVRQLFSNLMSNSLKFGGDRPVRIVISALEHPDPRRVTFNFADNGRGMPLEFSDKAFRLFHRLGQEEGTGIGLALCKRIVENHGGDIAMETNPGQGTTFVFTLPVA